MINTCPHCNRALLSHNSPRCNWCGTEIQNAAYQQEAQAGREAFYQHEAERDAVELARAQAMNINAYNPVMNPLTNTPMIGSMRTRVIPATVRQQPKASNAPQFGTAYQGDSPQEQENLEDATSAEIEDARFRHLEL